MSYVIRYFTKQKRCCCSLFRLSRGCITLTTSLFGTWTRKFCFLCVYLAIRRRLEPLYFSVLEPFALSTQTHSPRVKQIPPPRRLSASLCPPLCSSRVISRRRDVRLCHRVPVPVPQEHTDISNWLTHAHIANNIGISFAVSSKLTDEPDALPVESRLSICLVYHVL